MAELVNHHRLEHRVMSGSQGIGVVDTATAIGVRVRQDDDVFVWNARQPIVDALDPTGGEVTVRIECAEMRADCCRLPFVLQRDAYTAVCRRTSHRHNVEAVFQLVERSMSKQSFASGCSIAVEDVHFGFGITFGQNGYIDTIFHAAALVHVTVWGDAGSSSLVNQDIVRTDFMRQRSTHFVASILQIDGNDGLFLRERQEERVFEALLQTGCFFFAQPFLEQAGKRGTIDYFTTGFVLHGNFSITS